MDKFRVGQKVRVILKSSDDYGQIFTILEIKPMRYDGKMTLSHIVDSEPYAYAKMLGIPVAYEAHELEPVYDGDEKSNWSECVWQPNKVKA